MVERYSCITQHLIFECDPSTSIDKLWSINVRNWQGKFSFGISALRASFRRKKRVMNRCLKILIACTLNWNSECFRNSGVGRILVSGEHRTTKMISFGPAGAPGAEVNLVIQERKANLKFNLSNWIHFKFQKKLLKRVPPKYILMTL